MAYDERIAKRVQRILSERRGVVEKTMMGALAFMVNGKMCCSVGADGLLMRVRVEDRDKFLEGSHVSPKQLGGRTMTGFVRVAIEGCQTDAALAKWIALGIEAAKSRS